MNWRDTVTFGGLALAVGPILRAVATVLHPAETLNAASLAVAASQSAWLPAHVVLILSTLLIALGIVYLYIKLKATDNSAAPLAGLFLVMTWLTLRLFANAADGYATPAIALQFEQATGPLKEALGAVLVSNLILATSLTSAGFYLFAAGTTLLGVSIYRTGALNKVLAIVGIALSLGYLVAAPAGLFGSYYERNQIWMIYQVLLMTWLFAIGIDMVRHGRTREKARAS